jgi:hypothetical protein
MSYTPRISTVAVFVVLASIFGMTAAWLLQNNYASDEALYNWASIRAIFDAETLRLENLGFDRPHGPILALAPFYLIPGLQEVSPFAVSVAASAFLLTLWYLHLAQGGYSLAQRLILLSLIIVNPAILWSATAGGGEAIALLMFYLTYRSCLRMVYEKDIRSFIALGLALAVFVYCDVISIYLFIVLLPLLIFIVPIPMLRESPVSVYIIIGMPLMIVIGSWIYFNWIFLGEPLAFLHTYKSAFLGAMAQAETLPWLREYGGQFVRPMLIGLVYMLAGYPVLLFLLWRSRQEGRKLHNTMVLMFHPVISIGIASLTYFLASPLQITVLIIASVMAEIGRLKCVKTRCMVPLLFLLAASNATSWYMFVKDEYSHVRPWSLALQSVQAQTFPGDTRVGQWLDDNRSPTLIDIRSGFRAIVTRGDASNLLLPYSDEYRLAMRSEWPNVEQIAVPDPDTDQGKYDEINYRFPKLYESGMEGFERVYDEDGWRVYRRQY